LLGRQGQKEKRWGQKLEETDKGLKSTSPSNKSPNNFAFGSVFWVVGSVQNSFCESHLFGGKGQS
jgi:hypothetical protein